MAPCRSMWCSASATSPPLLQGATMIYSTTFHVPLYRTIRVPILAVTLLTLVLSFVACGGGDGSAPTASSASTPAATAVQAAPASTPAPASASSGSEGSDPSATPVPGATAPSSGSAPAPATASAPATPGTSASTPAAAGATAVAVPATPAPTEPAGPPGSPAMDRAALEAFYHALRGPAWDGKPSWGTDAPLGEWTGVSVEDGRVVGLRLGLVKELRGSLPPEMGDLGALRILHINDYRD